VMRLRAQFAAPGRCELDHRFFSTS
jgi:hypothetical protein